MSCSKFLILVSSFLVILAAACQDSDEGNEAGVMHKCFQERHAWGSHRGQEKTPEAVAAKRKEKEAAWHWLSNTCHCSMKHVDPPIPGSIKVISNDTLQGRNWQARGKIGVIRKWQLEPFFGIAFCILSLPSFDKILLMETCATFFPCETKAKTRSTMSPTQEVAK